MSPNPITCACLNDLCLSKVPLFASLDHGSLTKITSQMQHKSYRKGETIIREGSPSMGFTVIQQGSAKAYRITGDGREQILYIFPTYDYFGARFLFTEEVVPYSVEALEDSQVCILSKKLLMTLLAEHPPVAIELIEAMANRMRRLELVIQSMGGRNADMRIASLLLEFIDTYGKKTERGIVVKLPLSREGIANYLGIARETLSRKLTQMEEDGIISFLDSRLMLVENRESLVSLSAFAE
ncbi:MAG: Crp/Fnr family transcriptional regulator [Sphaerochaetaceae bacterium]|nr:Crp/Fnr family transcriptional regulator [Sphaerochaetaceae bacterium]MDY0372001.1 Crp/Fnr family transcriptional regulator [Sphaerochaetaceae bacterium]